MVIKLKLWKLKQQRKTFFKQNKTILWYKGAKIRKFIIAFAFKCRLF